MEFLPIIIVSSIGLSLCISYLLYHAVDFFRKRRKSPTIREEDVYVYCDEQESGDSLIINLQTRTIEVFFCFLPIRWTFTPRRCYTLTGKYH